MVNDQETTIEIKSKDPEKERVVATSFWRWLRETLSPLGITQLDKNRTGRRIKIEHTSEEADTVDNAIKEAKRNTWRRYNHIQRLLDEDE